MTQALEAEFAFYQNHLAPATPVPTALEVYEKYKTIDDQFVPTVQELEILFSRYDGKLTRSPCNNVLLQVEFPGKTIRGNRTALWGWYVKHREVLEEMVAARPVPF